MRLLPLFSLVLFVWLTAPGVHAQLSHEIAFPNLTFVEPVAIENAPDGENRLYVIEQPGRIRSFPNTPLAGAAPIFLDITSRVNDSGWEEGLLGLAFHPDYAENGYFYVNYTASGPRRTVVSRFTRSASDPHVADPDSELIIMEISQPFGNHNGGDLTFGPDGYLYIAVGDGGSGNDPQDHSQNTATLLGNVLRVDVNGGGAPPDCGAGPNANYTIPDNAIADGPGGACDEIYAWGLRNPWRFSFDPVTGWFWVADVGQVQREEVNIVNNGDNMGWRVKEGSLCHIPSNYGPPCNDPSLIDPIWEYGFSGAQSITGGFVYRGDRLPELYGKYVYADFMTGHIWALTYDGEAEPVNELLFNFAGNAIATFGLDENQHLYFSNRSSGRIHTFRSDTVGDEEGAAPVATALRLAGPNPFRGQTSLEFTLAESGEATLAVFDVLGRRVADLHDAPVAAGERTHVAFPAGDLAAGTYVVTLMVNGRVEATERVTVVP
jgi:glucose/arabinose dehydrogenase